MAKRKPLPDYRKPTSSPKRQSPLHVSGSESVQSTKRGVLRAQQKHQFDNCLWPIHPTLADRFHGLPAELRAHVFSHVLVQPVKWDIEHQSECPLRTSNEEIDVWVCNRHCAYLFRNTTGWRQNLNEGHMTPISPLRSKWAPDQTNPYLCSDCFLRFRPRPFPKASSLPCLCARRNGLEALLVCKRWYEEAGMVFYTQNTFAFEDASTFASFSKTLNPRWREVISKVSLMALSFELRPDEVLEDALIGGEDYVRHLQPGPSIWSLLRGLPSLSYLELDHIFLSNVKAVRSMQKLGLRTLKHLRFSKRLEEDPKWTSGTPTVWPMAAGRTLVSGGFAEEVARMVKGQRQRKFKCMKGLDWAVRRYNLEQENTRKKARA